MRIQSSNTSPEVERVQIELLRKAPLTKRFAITNLRPEHIHSFVKSLEAEYYVI